MSTAIQIPQPKPSAATPGAWLFAAPGVVLLFLFLGLPFLMAFVLSFTDQRLVTNEELGTDFVGLRNYLRLFEDDSFWAALKNNFLFVAVVAPLQSAFALLLAVMVNKPLKGSRIFRTVYFMPVATTMAVVAVVWSLMYNPDGGVINRFVSALSFGMLGPYDWLRDPTLVMYAVIALSIWQGVGFQMLVFLAGLQSIPEDLYEAAKLDGATPGQQFFWITLPLLKNTTIFVVVTTTIYAFQLFTQVQIIASSGTAAPIDSFRTVVMLMVTEGFKNGKIGYASALAVVFFAIVLALSMLQRALVKEESAVA
ncbi:sugar ABC transporter permease [Aquincola tertiaricarbonis]|uniref:Sugar ABC transporter permease n=1 Tax=Aquincola tertiaricarbonis TaxID=391953 RepID=A0ABY4SA28_AQUTE|nr:sugar ABC transporter permease [Aquincola tertiaricarbonis]URI09060.1 sugar ABC transporter permease [Aquincola tertiaricarbonis]